MPKKIYVTRPYLPPLATYNSYLKKIWRTRTLTNNGYFVQKLEANLRKFLGVKHVFFVANGTIGLQIAIRCLSLTKEIITTPFTYVATIDSILWERAKPIFVDIDETFCINPRKIEEKINKNTQAILGVHVYGNPCNVQEIAKIAQKYKLKVIYDAAHAFGSQINGKSVVWFGDISVLSFHATKLFHTGEGGAIVTNDDQIARKIYFMRTFGHPEEEIETLGINAKNSEIHAALGLAILKDFAKILEKRKKITKIYDKFLDVDRRVNIKSQVKSNYAYYPVVYKSERELLKVKSTLEANNIFPRRYFYPSVNTLPFVKGEKCPKSESLSKRVLCLPLYSTLSLTDAQKIAKIAYLAQQKTRVSPLPIYRYQQA